MGPDAAGRTLVAKFVKTEKDTGCLALVTQHIYVGGNPRENVALTDRHAMSAAMLSKDWPADKISPRCTNKFAIQ